MNREDEFAAQMFPDELEQAQARIAELEEQLAERDERIKVLERALHGGDDDTADL